MSSRNDVEKLAVYRVLNLLGIAGGLCLNLAEGNDLFGFLSLFRTPGLFVLLYLFVISAVNAAQAELIL